MESIKTNPLTLSEQSSSECKTKTCRKCGATFPASLEFFYRNKGGKYGLTPRCKSCVNEDNKESHEKRMCKEPEKVRAQSCARTKRYYHKNLEKSRKKNREYAKAQRADPVKRAKINARKRAGGAGLSLGQIDAMLASQGGCCAICRSPSPGAKAGWNLDHCHRTNSVRFVLCAHCNRGLGAFRDDPEIMRRAADMIEKLHQLETPAEYTGKYQDQPDRPVAAVRGP